MSDRLPTALLGLSLLGLIAAVLRLPAEVPVYFNLRGEADGYGPRGMLLLAPIVALAVDQVLRVVSPSRRAALAARWLVGLVLAGFAWLGVAVAAGSVTHLPPWAMMIGVVAMLGATILPLVLRARSGT